MRKERTVDSGYNNISLVYVDSGYCLLLLVVKKYALNKKCALINESSLATPPHGLS